MCLDASHEGFRGTKKQSKNAYDSKNGAWNFFYMENQSKWKHVVRTHAALEWGNFRPSNSFRVINFKTWGRLSEGIFQLDSIPPLSLHNKQQPLHNPNHEFPRAQAGVLTLINRHKEPGQPTCSNRENKKSTLEHQINLAMCQMHFWRRKPTVGMVTWCSKKTLFLKDACPAQRSVVQEVLEKSPLKVNALPSKT